MVKYLFCFCLSLILTLGLAPVRSQQASEAQVQEILEGSNHFGTVSKLIEFHKANRSSGEYDDLLDTEYEDPWSNGRALKWILNSGRSEMHSSEIQYADKWIKSLIEDLDSRISWSLPPEVAREIVRAEGFSGDIKSEAWLSVISDELSRMSEAISGYSNLVQKDETVNSDSFKLDLLAAMDLDLLKDAIGRKDSDLSDEIDTMIRELVRTAEAAKESLEFHDLISKVEKRISELKAISKSRMKSAYSPVRRYEELAKAYFALRLEAYPNPISTLGSSLNCESLSFEELSKQAKVVETQEDLKAFTCRSWKYFDSRTWQDEIHAFHELSEFFKVDFKIFLAGEMESLGIHSPVTSIHPVNAMAEVLEQIDRLRFELNLPASPKDRAEKVLKLVGLERLKYLLLFGLDTHSKCAK